MRSNVARRRIEAAVVMGVHIYDFTDYLSDSTDSIPSRLITVVFMSHTTR